MKYNVDTYTLYTYHLDLMYLIQAYIACSLRNVLLYAPAKDVRSGWSLWRTYTIQYNIQYYSLSGSIITCYLLFIIYMDHLPLATKLIRNIVREDNHTHAYTHTRARAHVYLHSTSPRGVILVTSSGIHFIELLFQRHHADDGKTCFFFKFRYLPFFFSPPNVTGSFFIVGRLLSLWLRTNT